MTDTFTMFLFSRVEYYHTLQARGYEYSRRPPQGLETQLTEAARKTMQIRSDEVKQVCERLETSATQAMTTMEVRTSRVALRPAPLLFLLLVDRASFVPPCLQASCLLTPITSKINLSLCHATPTNAAEHTHTHTRGHSHTAQNISESACQKHSLAEGALPADPHEHVAQQTAFTPMAHQSARSAQPAFAMPYPAAMVAAAASSSTHALPAPPPPLPPPWMQA